MLQFACPHCRAVLKAPASKEDAPIHCPRCDKKLRVPTAKEVRTGKVKIAGAGQSSAKNHPDRDEDPLDENQLEAGEAAAEENDGDELDEPRSGGGFKNLISSLMFFLVVGIVIVLGVRPLRQILLGMIEEILEKQGVPEWASPIAAYAIIAVVMIPPLLIVLAVWIKGQLLASVPVRLKFPAAKPEDIDGLDLKALDRYTKAFESLGFQRAKDFTLKTEVSMGNGFGRLFVHPEHHCYGEVNQVVQGGGAGAPMRANIMSLLEEGWAFSSGDRDPAGLSSLWLIRRPKALWMAHPHEKLKNILEAHLHRREEMIEGLKVDVISDLSAEAYITHERQAALDRRQTLQKKFILVGLIEMWLFSKNPKSEYMGSFSRSGKKRKKG